ncbi:MAG TPA: choice-of-anchor tandem repeat NxxGxxAF-containing protein [Chthonomonadaceae bacterium]|nr:choice-of-anchor tandem repeat NxxGxxAF-containing protein [Chthonomonadaceae bacterium]
MKRAVILLLSLTLLQLPGSVASHAQGLHARPRSLKPLLYRLTILARSGERAPDVGADSLYTFFAEPLIADDGTVAFTGDTWSPTDNSYGTGLFTTRARGQANLVALTGQPAPDGSSVLTGFGRPTLNRAGQVAYLGEFSDGMTGVCVNQSLVAQLGGPVPGLPDARFVALSDPAINDLGLVAFSAAIFFSSSSLVGASYNGGVFTQEQPLAFDTEAISGLPGVQILAQGNVAWLGNNAIGYMALLSDGSQAVFGPEGIVLRTDDPAPDGVGQQVRNIDPGVSGNEKGDLAYMVSLDSGKAIYVNRSLAAFEGELLPLSPPGYTLERIFWASSGAGALDAQGNVVYAGLFGTPNEGIVGAGVFLPGRVVAVTGQSIGDSADGLILTGIGSPARINSRGQIVFVGLLSTGDQAVILATPPLRSHAPPRRH